MTVTLTLNHKQAATISIALSQYMRRNPEAHDRVTAILKEIAAAYGR